MRLNHQLIARAEAKVDTQFQEQMSVASATLNEVESGGVGMGSVATSAGGRGEQHRGLAIMAASDSAKVPSSQEFSGVTVCGANKLESGNSIGNPAFTYDKRTAIDCVGEMCRVPLLTRLMSSNRYSLVAEE